MLMCGRFARFSSVQKFVDLFGTGAGIPDHGPKGGGDGPDQIHDGDADRLKAE